MSGVMRTIPRVLPRTAAVHVPRAFGTTAVNRTGLKDSIKNVDRKVSDKLVDGIDIGGTFPLTPNLEPPSLPQDMRKGKEN